MSDAIPLPSRPDLEQYKKLARDLQVACRSSDADAVRMWATHWLERTAYPATARERNREVQRMLERWEKLKKANEHLAACKLAGTQLFLAREHGFKSWPKFARHVEGLARAGSVSTFEAAADAIVSGDAAQLRKLLADNPGLVRERSTRQHRSTLLHYVSANGVEDYRQKTPANIVEITHLLLDAGAEVNAASDAYGGGCTALGLVATSIHPERAGVQIPLLQTLLDRGATFDQPSATGNRHSFVYGCLANGQPAAARFFADRGAHLDLESAAALGRIDVLRSFFDGDRPPAKSLQSALLYACGYGSREAAEFLLDRGVDAAAFDEEDHQTGLHWANYGPHIDVIRLLIARGAPVNAREKRYRAAPIDMALWTWANSPDADDRERCYEAVALLTRAGAIFDPEQWRDPGEDRSAMLDKIDSDPRMLAALRGE
jgi:ankyrin repeat protein